MLSFNSIKESGNSYIISNFPLKRFSMDLKREYKSKKLDNLLEAVGVDFKRFIRRDSRNVRIHKFFIPELVYLLKKFNYPKGIVDRVVNETWISSIDRPVNNRIDLSNIKKEMHLTLKNYQEDFVSEYDIKKQKYQLNGYLLSFDQGLGKTLTTLALMTALKKKVVIIIAPKSTLQTVWVDHLERFYKRKQKISLVGRDSISPNSNFIILNYEAMEKLNPIISALKRKSEEVGIIVDESHNFLRQKSNRTSKLIKLRQDLGCKDTLLMSGTPIKALGLEVIPLLLVLDPFFDEEAVETYKKSFGVNTTIAGDILRTRMNILMHRKVKGEVLKLPNKREEIVKIKLPYGAEYSVDHVKKVIKTFTEERFEYHKSRMDMYVETFYSVIDYLKGLAIGDTLEFKEYLKNIEYLRANPVTMQNEYARKVVTDTNEYERNVLLPELPNDLKKKFKEVKSAVKYVHLKVRGEVIGRLLSRLRIKMTMEMIEGCKLEKLVFTGLKKTVVFTSYTDVIEEASRYLKTKNLNPVLVYGKTANDTKKIVDRFKNEDDVNPIIASLLSMSTGVTLTEADTMIFLNKPWRHVDYAQASDRIHRIGQDVDVTIYSLVLDTGETENLSTRMESISEWSKEQFETIVGDST